MPVIAAVRFKSAAIGVNGVQFGQRVFVQGMHSLEQNAPILQHINGKKIPRSIRELQRLLVADAERGNFQHEFTRDLMRIYKAVRRNIKRPDAIVVALRDLAQLSARNKNLPALPAIAGSPLSRKQHVLSIERDVRIRGGEETGNQRPVAVSILNENCDATWESFCPANPCHWVVFARNGVQQRNRLRAIRARALWR